MKRLPAAILLLAVQLALVLSVAGKYLYERKTRPRVWVRTGVYDPDQPMRGRYLALHLLVDGCSLPLDEGHEEFDYRGGHEVMARNWTALLVAENGNLVARLQPHARPDETTDVRRSKAEACDRTLVSPQLEYFIPEHAQTPFPLKPGQELWVEVTVPGSGPPRPIQLAVAQAGNFTALRFE